MLKMQYQVISDDCDCCSYSMHALKLLNLSFSTISLKQLEGLKDKSKAASGQMVLICQQSFSKLSKKDLAALEHINILLVAEEAPKTKLNKSVYLLSMPFNIHSFKKCLLTLSVQSKSKNFDACFSGLVGVSDTMSQIKDIIIKVAECDSSVIISGETGTGKDVVANAIHSLSIRAKHPFVPINCGAIPSELIESEFFGHEKGSFTGAYSKKIGRFEFANKGTVFLDEIGDMPYHLQVKLLRVIQDKCFQRVGSHEVINTDARIIAATNKDLEAEVKAGRFREDLYYRLNVISITMPSLKERAEDIPLLIEHFLSKISDRIGHSVSFAKDAIAMIASYSWPGNIRELANFLERMVILHQDETITAESLMSHYPRMNKDPIVDMFAEECVSNLLIS